MNTLGISLFLSLSSAKIDLMLMGPAVFRVGGGGHGVMVAAEDEVRVCVCVLLLESLTSDGALPRDLFSFCSSS